MLPHDSQDDDQCTVCSVLEYIFPWPKRIQGSFALMDCVAERWYELWGDGQFTMKFVAIIIFPWYFALYYLYFLLDLFRGIIGYRQTTYG